MKVNLKKLKNNLTPIFGMVMFLLLVSCKNTVPENAIVITGTIKEQTMTTYQYGTHTLSSEQRFFALTSKTVDLDNYLNEEITIVAEEIEGYPVDGGPIYLRVLKVKQ